VCEFLCVCVVVVVVVVELERKRAHSVFGIFVLEFSAARERVALVDAMLPSPFANNGGNNLFRSIGGNVGGLGGVGLGRPGLPGQRLGSVGGLDSVRLGYHSSGTTWMQQ
jgi:hypothetical protein